MRYKFLWNGIKDTETGKLYKCSYYYRGVYGKEPDGIYIMARDYSGLPKIPGLKIINESNLICDWFENDRIFVKPNNKYYRQVEEALRKRLEHYMKIQERRNKKK